MQMPETTNQQPIEQMAVIDHLQELRLRLIVACIAVAVSSAVCFYFVEDLLHLITQPAGKLYYLNPAEGFFAYMKITVFAGFLLALPVVLYQAWVFVVPALTRSEKRMAIFLVPASVVLFYLGLAFSYYLVMPVALKFFMGFANESLQPLLSLGQYLSFVLSMLLPFGFIFELPLVLFTLAKLGVISSAFLAAKRKIVLLLAFVAGGVISPTPDLFGQVIIAVPLLLLYEASIWIVKTLLHK